VFEAGEKVAIEAWLLPTRRRVTLARRRDLVDCMPEGDKGLGWVFDNDAVGMVNGHLARLDSRRAVGITPLLVLDELGVLELVHGTGFTAGLELLDTAVFPTAIAVVRPALLATAQRRWESVYPQINIVTL
jgi:hypothetical protein